MDQKCYTVGTLNVLFFQLFLVVFPNVMKNYQQERQILRNENDFGCNSYNSYLRNLEQLITSPVVFSKMFNFWFRSSVILKLLDIFMFKSLYLIM